MLSRQCLEDVDAQFTKIQVWKVAAKLQFVFDVFPNMFYHMDEFKKVTEVFFKNKDGRRSYVGLDI